MGPFNIGVKAGMVMYRILIVEDDITIAGILEKHFASWDMEARRVRDLSRVTDEFSAFSPHLVIMDISLPFYNGYHWCSEIRRTSRVPILFLSSASDNMNIVMAVNMGGDDFVAKLFDLDVINAKVRALLRRSYDFSASPELLEHRGLVLNPSDATFTYGGERFDLTKNEYRILQILLEHKGKIVSRETLMQRLWETDIYVDENTLTVNMTRLRKTLASAGIEHFITTKKGIGYLVEETD